MSSDGRDTEAAKLLTELAIGAVDQLNRQLAQQRPDLFRPIARKYWQWPALVSEHPDCLAKDSKHPRYLERLLQLLEVGQDSPLNVSRKIKWSLNRRPASFTAHQMLEWVDQQIQWVAWLRRVNAEPKNIRGPEWLKRQKLPSLLENRKAWFDVGWGALKAAHGGHPEKDNTLRPLGEHRGKHSQYTGAQRAVTPRTKEANIRDGIREALWRAFRNQLRRRLSHS